MMRQPTPWALALALAASILGGCGHSADLVLHFKQQTLPPSPCAIHDGLADFGIGTIAVLPFRASDKNGPRTWKGPDGKELEEIVYPFTDDGHRFAGLLQAALAATRTYTVVEASQIHEVVEEMGLGEVIATDSEMARQVAQVVGADAVVIGRVEAYRGELRHVAVEEELIALYRGAVYVIGQLVHAESGTVLAHCQKGANSQAFLEKNYALTLDLLEEGNPWGKASHGKEVGEKVAFIAVQIAAEMAKELTVDAPVQEGEAPGEDDAAEDADAASSDDGDSSKDGDTGAGTDDRGEKEDDGDAGADNDSDDKGDGKDADAESNDESKDDADDESTGASDSDSDDGSDWRDKMRKRQPHARPGT